MSSLKLYGSTSGYVEVVPEATAGNNSVTLPNGSGTLVVADGSGNVNISGIITASQINVGTGVTIYGNTGIISATKFYGDGSGLTGIAAGGSSGISTTTTAERNAGVSTATGTVIYNVTENAIQAYSGSEWNLAPGKVSAFRAYPSSNQDIIDAGTTSPQFSQTKITFDNNSLSDNLGEFNTTSNSFVPLHTGIYYLTITTQWAGNNSMINGGEVWSRLIKNGTYTGNLLNSGTGTQLSSMFTRTFTAGNLNERGVFHSLSWVGPLTAGDSVTVTLYQRSGVTFTIIGNPNGTTSFSGFRVA